MGKSSWKLCGVVACLVALAACATDPTTTGTISGHVTDAVNSQPIAGATVTTQPATSSATTDAQGNYRLANVNPGSYTVNAAKSGYQNGSTSATVVEGQTATANIALLPTTGTISGRVTDANNSQPISGATVTTQPATATVTTDAQGNYTIPSVAPGGYTVNASKTGHQNGSGSATVVAGQTATANIALTPLPGTISGRVTDASNSQPIAGATVSTQPATATATVTTDAQGNYTIPNVAPGGYTVNAAKSGYQNGSAGATVVAGQTATANIALTPLPGTISGRVTDASSSQPIAGATVTTQPGTATVTTDAQGNYTIPNVAPGGYTVNASKTGYQNGSGSATVVTGQTATANIALTPLPGTISGRVTDASTSQPIAGATVSTQPATASVTTDAQGNYTIPNVAPSAYTVNAVKSGYLNGSTSATVVAGQTATANIALTPLPPTGTISGRVTDASNSQPIAGATVSTQPATASVTTDAQGNYSIANVNPGSYTVNAAKSGYQNGSAGATVVAGQTATANIALTPVPGTISGRVSDASNSQPIAGATVTTQPATSTVVTDAQGNYSIANVIPGSYTVRAARTGYNTNSTSVVVTAGQTVTANIALTPVINYDGSWSGTTSQDSTVSFTIVNNALTEFRIRVILSGALCTGRLILSISFSPPRPITGNTFSFLLSPPQNPIGSVSGTFSSNTSASGTWSFTYLDPQCAALSGSGTWTATKQ